MTELFARLFARPLVAAEILAASLLASLLGLSSAVFVMLVLNRYVAHGVDATLATLSAGVVLAILLEFGFRLARFRLARAVGRARDGTIATGAFGALTGAAAGSLDQMPPGARREAMAAVDSVAAAYSPANLCAVMDVPMALVFVAALFLLDPFIAAIACAFVVAALLLSLSLLSSLKGAAREASAAGARRAGLIGAASGAADTVRAFNARDYLRRLWQAEARALDALRRRVAGRQNLVQTLTQLAQGLMGVAVIAYGAILVVKGQLDVGALIGANILAARALVPVARLAHLVQEFAKARQAIETLRELSRLPAERAQGTELSEYRGGLEFKDLGFAYPGATTPLFESLSLRLDPGAILVVAGGNGSGKTTLARMIVGLLAPGRGQILADGVDLQQLDPTWWRRQVIYLPQEPRFLPGTLRVNLFAYCPGLNDATIARLIATAGLKTYLDRSPGGLDAPVAGLGESLSLGIRRRFALARALASDGALVLFDEPTEGLDAEGAAQVYGAMNDLARRGRTVIAFSHDPNIVRGANLILDLGVKPVPAVRPAPSANAAKPTALAAIAGSKEAP